MTTARRRIFVTGAAGFVGSWVLARAGDVCGSGVAVRPFETAAGERVDIRDREAVMALVADLRPDAIIHLAAIASPPEARANPFEAWRVNLFGTLHLADALIAHAPDAAMIFASTSEVYGLETEGGSRVAEPLRPASVYGATKAAAEIALRQKAHEGLRHLALRPFNHTGPGQSADYVVPAFARQVAEIEAGLSEPVVRHGNLDTVKGFLDVRDVADAYLTAAMLPVDRLPKRALTLCGEPVRIEKVLADLIALSDRPIEAEADPARYRPSDQVAILTDNADAEGALGWSRRHSFDTTLRDVLDDWRRRIGETADGT